MKTLLILRHAKSSWDDRRRDDHQRPLNARGERDAPRMGRLMRDQGLIPAFVVSSDALRARLTAEAVAVAAEYPGTILLEPRLYHAGAVDILAILRDVIDTEFDSVMVVGHNPGLEELVTQLTGEREDMPTAALARIELPIDRWSALDTTVRGALIDVWRPRDLKR